MILLTAVTDLQPSGSCADTRPCPYSKFSTKYLNKYKKIKKKDYKNWNKYDFCVAAASSTLELEFFIFSNYSQLTPLVTSWSTTVAHLTANEADVSLRSWQNKKKRNKTKQKTNRRERWKKNPSWIFAVCLFGSALLELRRATWVLDADNSGAARAAQRFQLPAKQGQRKVLRAPHCAGSAERGGVSARQEVHHPITESLFCVNRMCISQQLHSSTPFPHPFSFTTSLLTNAITSIPHTGPPPRYISFNVTWQEVRAVDSGFFFFSSRYL